MHTILEPLSAAEATALAAHERLAALDAEYRTLAARLRPDRESSGSLESTLEARLRLPHIEREVLEATVRARAADRVVAEARQADRERRRHECEPRVRAAVRRLGEALDAAAEANAVLAGLEDAAEADLGSCERFAWPELRDEGPTLETRLAHWRRRAAEAGLLD